MEEKPNTLKKNGLSRGEIVLMSILVPLIFCVMFGASSCLIVYACGGIGNSEMGTLVWGPIGFLIILGFGIAWVYIVRRLFKEYRKAKILFTTIGFAILTAALIIWILAKIPHMKYG